MICILHGISIGLAIDLSTCCDVRICAADTRFAVKEVDIGLAADIGTLSRLPKAVGSFSWVKDVCLSARFFDAKEALSVGFVSQIHESKAAAIDAGLKMADLIASKSPVAVQGTKELLNHARDHTVAESRSILSAPHPVDHVVGICSAKNIRLPHYHRSALHCRLELSHAAVQRCLRGAAIGYPEEKADIRETVDEASSIALYSRVHHEPLAPVCVPTMFLFVFVALAAVGDVVVDQWSVVCSCGGRIVAGNRSSSTFAESLSSLGPGFILVSLRSVLQPRVQLLLQEAHHGLLNDNMLVV